jgi:hypothetical protein
MEKASADLMSYRRLMEIRRATGDTGITVNPFKGTFSTYGRAFDAVSEQVAQ